jgi:hypothetical protein
VSVDSTHSARVNSHNLTLLARYQVKSVIQFSIICHEVVAMNEALIKRVRSELARLGGQARAKKLGAKRRKEIATKASKAAAKARTRKAKERKAKKRESA